MIYYQNNISYEGDFINGDGEGNGKLIFPSGNYYIGEFHKNERHGKGIMFSSENKIIYDGNFENDGYNGEGKLLINNDNYYDGIFKDGKRNGHGVIFD